MISAPINTAAWPRWPQSDERTSRAIEEVISSGRWAISGPHTGEKTQEQLFAERFAAYNNSPHCITLDHGTSALIAALEALDIGYGDEVIVPGLAWVAPVIAVLSVNAIPVCVDIDAYTLCIDPNAINEAINERTRAIIPIHMYGCMANMDLINAIATRNELVVIEDAAHSHGAEWHGQRAGTLGDIGVFSMQQGKPLTCGEGGAALTKDHVLKERIENSSWNARRRLSPNVCLAGNMQLINGLHRFGTNRCISEFQAAILLEQLERLDAQIDQRNRAAAWLDSQLTNIPGISIVQPPAQITRRSYYGYVFRIEEENFGIAAHSAIAHLQRLLGMGDFLLHAPYPAMNENPLCVPHPVRHALPIYNNNPIHIVGDLEQAGLAYKQVVVMHHSVLLAPQEQLASIVKAVGVLQKNTQTILA